MNSPFSIPEGIAIQTTDLARWESVLSPEAFSKVFREATKNNRKATTGYDICRGDSITALVIKLSYQARP